jgi:hypothetical protein
MFLFGDDMPFRLIDIIQEWLLGQTVDYPSDDVVNGFNNVERIMGSGWLESTFSQIRGPAVSIQIIELGNTLKEIDGVPNGSDLISKIKTYYPRSTRRGNTKSARAKLKPTAFRSSDELHELAHALTVAKFVAHFRRHSLKVEIEPELFIRNERRHPDFRINYDNAWVYVEVVSPGLSKEANSIYKTLNSIADVNKKMRMDRVAEVYLFKDPTNGEIDQIVNKCMLMAENDLQPQECSFKKTAQIFTNLWNQERLPTFPPAIDEKRPILVVVDFQTKNEGDTIHGRKCVAKMPFLDERAQRILGEKSRQLSRDFPGLIIVDVSNAAGGLKRWPELIRRRLQPNLNRRISAVLITQSSISTRSSKTENRLIEHPNPIHQLPRDLIAITALES